MLDGQDLLCIFFAGDKVCSVGDNKGGGSGNVVSRNEECMGRSLQPVGSCHQEGDEAPGCLVVIQAYVKVYTFVFNEKLCVTILMCGNNILILISFQAFLFLFKVLIFFKKMEEIKKSKSKLTVNHQVKTTSSSVHGVTMNLLTLVA